ncbi:MAG: LysE family translocator [Geminicoccaceae bacterium]|nr:LysE family translocator [Geminicoccaceae bacterium]
MSLHLWLAFVIAASVILIIPGPTVVYVVAVGLTRGRRMALSAVPGVVAGDLVAMALSLAGVGTILALSATIFSIVKVAGAAYLVWIGINLWRDAGRLHALSDDARRARPENPSMRAFWITMLNPKSILFFVAFMPQFVVLDRPLILQFAILGATFLLLAAINIAGYAWLSGTVAHRVSPAMRCRFQRGGALCLVAAGVLSLWHDATDATVEASSSAAPVQ